VITPSDISLRAVSCERKSLSIQTVTIVDQPSSPYLP
jgi:hypothetical protein